MDTGASTRHRAARGDDDRPGRRATALPRGREREVLWRERAKLVTQIFIAVPEVRPEAMLQVRLKTGRRLPRHDEVAQLHEQAVVRFRSRANVLEAVAGVNHDDD